MIQPNPYRATIPPIPEGQPRPLWSVMIPTYNCADYLRQTLASVLAQDPGAEVMQIEVIDDHSTKDDPAAVVEELGRGRVGFYRQPKNVGYIENFNTCLKRSRGRLIHLLHGDDCIGDGFYGKLQQVFEQNPEIGAAFCRHIFMDGQGHWLSLSRLEQPESGILKNWIEQIAVMNRIQPPSMAVRRDVYENIGGFDQRIACCAEDWELWLRIAAQYPIGYEVEPLAMYRLHSGALTGRCERTGQNLRDLRKIIEISQPYLPAPIASELSNQARENWALYALTSITPKLLAQKDVTAAITQIQEALKCSHSRRIIRELPPLFFPVGKLWLKSVLRSGIFRHQESSSYQGSGSN